MSASPTTIARLSIAAVVLATIPFWLSFLDDPKPIDALRLPDDSQIIHRHEVTSQIFDRWELFIEVRLSDDQFLRWMQSIGGHKFGTTPHDKYFAFEGVPDEVATWWPSTPTGELTSKGHFYAARVPNAALSIMRSLDSVFIYAMR